MNTNPILLLLYMIGDLLTKLHLATPDQVTAAATLIPDGRVSFHNNHVTTFYTDDEETEQPPTAEGTPYQQIWDQATFSALFVSLDDISLTGNQFQATVPPYTSQSAGVTSFQFGLRFIHVASMGTTIRAVGNGISEGLNSTILSYYSMALRTNLTTSNEATHAFLTSAPKNAEANNLSLVP